MSLMAERDFESITVVDICERAMVHRTTFYKHYEDKYGLLFHGIQDELKALFESVDGAVDKPVELDKEIDTQARHVAIFEHVLKHEEFYRLMLTGDGLNRFSTMMRKSLAERLEPHLAQQRKHLSLPIALHAQLQAAMIVSMITWWLENDRPYTPAEMIKYIYEHIGLLG
jgi:AcrR family transcriptional regulator